MLSVISVVQPEGKAGIWTQVRLSPESILLLNYHHVYLPIPHTGASYQSQLQVPNFVEDPKTQTYLPEADFQSGREEKSILRWR